MTHRLVPLSVVPLLVGVLALSGCAALLPAPAITSAPSPSAAAETETADGPQPTAGAVGADAAQQLIELRWDALVAGDWDAACSLYSDGYIERLLSVVSSDATDCAGALAAEADGVAEVLATADAEGYAPRVPYYYVPSGILVDAAALEVDSDDLVYVPGTAVTSTDPAVFEEGASATPGWLTETAYIQRDADGRWSFITASERAE